MPVWALSPWPARTLRYLASIHWILGQFTPAPSSVHARNCSERLYNVFVIFFALLVVGSCISRVSATIQQVIKLNSEAPLPSAP